MIRRRVGNDFWLIPQHDHALLSGALASHFGNTRFAKPAPTEHVIDGVSLHDCGWPIHDDEPTLNKNGFPMDVFETTPNIGLAVWTESAKRALSENPYTGLLVSLHSLSLSVLATSQVFDNEHFDVADARVKFEVNKFQHNQIELQESLRKQIGLRTDIPLNCGLANNSSDRDEQQLEFNFRLLQAMDKLSLCICCSKPPFAKVEPLIDHPGGRPISLAVSRPKPEKLIVSPWPFDEDRIEVTFPFKRFDAAPISDEQDFRESYAVAPIEHFNCTVSPR
jgi:hypothetical protein